MILIAYCHGEAKVGFAMAMTEEATIHEFLGEKRLVVIPKKHYFE